MKNMLLLSVSAFFAVFLLQACLSDEEVSHDENCEGVVCGKHAHCEYSGICICDSGYTEADGICSALENDGDIDSDDYYAEQNQEEETPPDLCAGKSCPLPDVCEMETACNPANGECETIFSDEGESCDDGIACNGQETCDGAGNCRAGNPIVCGTNESCTEPDGLCDCFKPFEWQNEQCVPMTCITDSDCDDELSCNGSESCNKEGLCTVGETIECDYSRQCSEPHGQCVCANEYYDDGNECIRKTECPVPQAVRMSQIHKGAQITFSTPLEYSLEISNGDDAPGTWTSTNHYIFNEIAEVRLWARSVSDTCLSDRVFSFRYKVMEHYPPAAGQDGSTAVHMDSQSFKAWADGYVEPVAYGVEVDETWRTPEKALGPANGSSTDIVSLGRGGSITLTFSSPIKNGPSYDFAVFENSFNDDFLELAYVEVSSDGQHFQRFNCAYLGVETVGAFGGHNTGLIGGLAGKYRVGWGTPFDLEELAYTTAVLEGELDLNNVRFVRITDVVGDGSRADSFGNPIYAPYPTVGSAGFDLEAIGVINN